MSHTPSDEQALIYKHTRLAKKRKSLGKRSNFIVNANAGSGKTYTTIQAVEGLVKKFPNDSVLIMMFNKHNQVETAAKLAHIKNAQVQTTYSAGLSVLRQAKMTPQMKNGKYWFICKELIDAKRDQIISLFKPANVPSCNMTPDQIKAAINKATSQLNEISSMAMNTLSKLDTASLMDMIVKYDKDCDDPILLPMVEKVISIGMDSLKKRTMMAFIDMIYGPIHFDLPFPHKDWIIIDEAQDLNACQLEICLRFGKNSIVSHVAIFKTLLFFFQPRGK